MILHGHLSGSAVAPVPNRSVRIMGYGPVQFTVEDALNMVRQGILPEDSRIELLDGSLVYRDRFDLRGSEVVEGVKHNYVINALARLSVQINDSMRELRTQSTLICSESHAPIPDAVILRGTLEDYSDRLPEAPDAFCVIEVADSSYERDAGEKLQAYARAGVGQYIIINLRNRTAEVYSQPEPASQTYGVSEVVAEGDLLSLRVGPQDVFTSPLSDLLP